MKNQMLGIILMTVLIFIWLNYFTQRPAVGPEPGPPDGQTASGPAEPDRDAGPSAPASGAEAASGWPQLPPVPESVLPDDEITIENDQLRLVFTRIGARLKRAEVILDKEANDVVELVPHSDKPDTEAVYPLGLWFPAQQELGDALNYRRFDASIDPSGHAVTFTLATPAVAVAKTFALTETPFVIDAGVRIDNREGAGRRFGLDQTPAYIFAWAPDVDSPDKTKGVGQTIVVPAKTTTTIRTPGNSKRPIPPGRCPTPTGSPSGAPILSWR